MACFDKKDQLPPPRIAAGGKGAERVAVIALVTRDDMPALRPAGFDEILARQFQRRFDGLEPPETK